MIYTFKDALGNKRNFSFKKMKFYNKAKSYNVKKVYNNNLYKISIIFNSKDATGDDVDSRWQFSSVLSRYPNYLLFLKHKKFILN